MSGVVAAGMAQPHLAAQSHFRAVLEAMGRPGRPIPLSGYLPLPPQGLLPSSYAVLLSLADFETPLWLGPGVDSPAARSSLRFHAGSPVVDEASQAAFAVVAAADEAPPLDRFACGTAEFPDRSATVVVQCPTEHAGAAARLSGPGIERPFVATFPGTTTRFWHAAQANAGLFPRGVDIVLAAPRTIFCLPRSTRIEVL